MLKTKLTVLILTGSLLAGCGTANHAVQNTNKGIQNVGYYTGHSLDEKTIRQHKNQSIWRGQQTKQVNWDHSTAQKVTRELNQLKDVKDSSVLVTGDSVIVGIQTEPNVHDTQTIKNRVKQMVKRYYQDRHVRVVTNNNMVNRMTDVNQKMSTGANDPDKLHADVRGIERDVRETK